MAHPKQRSILHIMEDDSTSIFRNKLPSEWVVRQYKPDYGIDLAVEIFDKAKGKKGLFETLSMGNISIKLAAKTDNTILLSRPFPGLITHYIGQLTVALDNILPNIKEDEKQSFYKRLLSGSRPGIDYYIMVLLSSVIATLGLLLNSPAVIIGAMLVAPLMTPIISTAMGIAIGESSSVVIRNLNLD